MAKEAELKKIELMVSVNCCDGCKRKVKKALRGVEGVLNTEIDPLQPKVTVLGSVDPKILIKRLLKAGKQAELWSSGNQNAGKEKKEVEMPAKNENEKSKSECDQAKPSDPYVKTTDKIKESNNGSSVGNEEKASKKDKKSKESNEEKASKKDDKSNENPVNSYIPEVIKTENPTPSIPVPEMNFRMYPNMVHDARTQTHYCYMVEPYPITMPYYAIPSYPTHPLPHSACCGQGYFCHDRQVYQPQFQDPTTRVGDYFSDENTVGCSVM